MIHAAGAYQERKVKHVGFLWSSLLFRPDISPDYGHYLLNLADRLTWRQLVTLAFFAEYALSDRMDALSIERQRSKTPFAEGLGVEVAELGDLSLMGIRQDEDSVVKLSHTLIGESTTRHFEDGTMLVHADLMPTGQDLCDLMELDRIPESEKERIVALMQPET